MLNDVVLVLPLTYSTRYLRLSIGLSQITTEFNTSCTTYLDDFLTATQQLLYVVQQILLLNAMLTRCEKIILPSNRQR